MALCCPRRVLLAGMTPNLPVDKERIRTQLARLNLDTRSTTLKEMEHSLQRVAHTFLVASTRLHHLPLEEQLELSASILEISRNMAEYWTWADKHLRDSMILPKE